MLATGHYRNGILLTPLTADAVAATVPGTLSRAEVAPFGPGRFGGRRRRRRRVVHPLNEVPC